MLKGFKYILLLVFNLWLASCNTLPPDQLKSVDFSTVIEQQLDQFVDTSTPKKVEIPSAVSDALLPSVGSAMSAYNPDMERFDISVRDLDAHEFYRALVKDTPFNIVVDPQLKGVVNLDLKNVTLEEVMDLVRELNGYEYKRKGSLFQVLPGGLRTEIFQVNYLNISRHGGSEVQVSAGQVTDAGASGRRGNSVRGNSSSPQSGSQRGNKSVIGTRITTTSDSNFWGQLERTLMLIVGGGDGRSVVIAPEAGVVVVRGLPRELRTVENFLRRTELSMQRQVILEAKIIEVILDDAYAQGIKWSSLSEFTDDIAGDGQASKFLKMGQSSRSVTNPELGGVFSAALRINDFEALIQLLSTQGTVQVLSSPRISTVNNQKAVIKVGSDEFFVTEIRVDQNNNVNSTNQTNTDVELTPFFSGIALDVTPQISEDGRIVLHVHPSISKVDDQTKVVSLGDRDLTLPLALSTIRETDSVISTVSGQVVVIGGLISDVRQENNARVPFLGRLPLVGGAFVQKERIGRKSELVILIKAIVVTPEVYQMDLENSRKRFSQLRSAYR